VGAGAGTILAAVAVKLILLVLITLLPSLLPCCSTFQRCHERGLIQYNFLSSWIYPSVGVPFARTAYYKHVYEHHKRGPRENVMAGMSDLACGIYVEKIGWVGANDPREPYGETASFLDGLLEDMLEKQV
jgi:hypothetical protein